MLKIGCHVSMSGKLMFKGSVADAISYGANSFMIYTGAPQNTRRKAIEDLNLEAGYELMKENNMNMEDVIIHAPYIINLANTIKSATYEIAVSFLREEIQRVTAIGAKYVVLHPGSHVGAGEEAGLNSIVKGLNEVLTSDQAPIICLETMAGKGKGSELGNTFEQIAFIINNVNYPEKLGVCLDTCHINDAGYDLSCFDDVLDEFDEIIGLDKLYCIHINDSQNERGIPKDRHDNIGYGHIGFENMMNIVYNERLDGIPMMLETPYVNDRSIAPYKTEIKMIKERKFEDWLDENRFIKGDL